MDKFNLWDDDPEELLLELGFGCDEPDISGRIPARFINYQSQARGINLQVFLKAQQDRLDLENPDVSNRFRQLEVLQQVTTAFSSLVGMSSSPLGAPHGKDQSVEAQTRRRYFRMVFRRASKKSLSRTKHTSQEPTGASVTPPEHTASSPGRNGLTKRGKSGPMDTTPLSPLAEEQVGGPGSPPPCDLDPSVSQEEAFRPASLTGSRFMLRRKRPRQAKESFEMEEIHSLDGSTANGGITEGAENVVQRNIRTNSCQSDSSGFFEEPFVPSDPQLMSRGSQLIKAPSALPGRSFDSHTCEAPRSLPPLISPSPNPLTDIGLFHSPPNEDKSPNERPSAFLCKLHNSKDSQTPCPPTCVSAPSFTPFPSTEPASGISQVKEDTIVDTSEGPLHPPNSEGTTCFIISGLSPQTADHLFQPNVDSQFYLCTATSYTSTDFPGIRFDSQSQSTEDHIDAHHGLLPLTVTSPTTPPSASHKYLPPFDCSSKRESISQTQQPSQEESSPLDPEKLDTFHSEGNRSSSLSRSQDQDGFIGLFVQNEVDLKDQTKIRQLQKISSQLNTQSTCEDPSALASPNQNFIYVEMDQIVSDFEVTLKMKEKQKADRGKRTDNVQLKTDLVSISHTAGWEEGTSHVSKEGHQTEGGENVYFNCSVGEFSPKAPDSRKGCQMGSDGPLSESPGSGPILRDQVPVTKSNSDFKTIHLMEIDSLDVVFETSVDGSDSENEDVQAFFQQLDNEGKVYWAEPVQVSSVFSVCEESGPFDAANKSEESLPDQLPGYETGPSNSFTILAVDSILSNAVSSNTKASCRSVSVQMSSGLSSHIVHRKDVPYMTKSQQSTLSSILPLDTSTPFRAVQSWTDLQIQRNALAKKFPHKTFDTVQNNILKSDPERTQNPEPFPPSAFFPLLSIDWQSHETLPETAEHCETVSVDTGLWPDEQDLMEGIDAKPHVLWKHCELAKAPCCCSSCDDQCSCWTEKCQHNRNSSDELQNMRLCLQHFCSVLNDVEEQLSEDQAAVFSSLSMSDRDTLRDIEELRHAVKQEAVHLQTQLDEFVVHPSEIFRMSLHRLLEEQSLLCSELRVCPPGAMRTWTSRFPNRTVATQCWPSPQLS